MENRTQKQTPIEAIMQFCLACYDGSKYNVEHCKHSDCELYEFRLGLKTPLISREKKPDEPQGMSLIW